MPHEWRHTIEMLLPLLTDLRRALRGLRKSRTYTLVAISSMGLGIGVNVTVYSIAREMRMAAGFVGSMSGVGLLLALSGLYSSVSYAAKRRTREMAIRVAVGATRSGIVWAAVRDGVAVLACGVAVGIPLAVAVIRPLTGILPDGLDPWNPVTFVAVVLVLLATEVAAAWIPARSAANVDPSFVLRQD